MVSMLLIIIMGFMRRVSMLGLTLMSLTVDKAFLMCVRRESSQRNAYAEDSYNYVSY